MHEYAAELQLKKTNTSDKELSVLEKKLLAVLMFLCQTPWLWISCRKFPLFEWCSSYTPIAKYMYLHFAVSSIF